MRNKLKIFYKLLFFGMLFLCIQQGLCTESNPDADSVKSSNNIAIAVVGDSINSKISSISGRAPYYLIFDRNGVFLKSIKNPALGYRRGASSGVINLLLEESCTTVIAGKFGDKMKIKLEANKIEYIECGGIADKVVRTFTQNSRSENAQE